MDKELAALLAEFMNWSPAWENFVDFLKRKNLDSNAELLAGRVLFQVEQAAR